MNLESNKDVAIYRPEMMEVWLVPDHRVSNFGRTGSAGHGLGRWSRLYKS